MIVQKNRHLEAATAILGNKRRAKALLRTLEPRTAGSYQFVVQGKGEYHAALLLIHHAGATTTLLVTPPKSTEETQRISHLITTAIESLEGRPTRLAQTSIDVDDSLLEKAFQNAGFDTLTILTYMELSTAATSDETSNSKVSFVSMEDATDAELQTVLSKTYIGSLDCPKIHGLRHIEDIIEGHRNQGSYDAQLWNIAVLEGAPVGVLLLNPIPEATCMELSYLGVTPSTRGKGVGDAMMSLAIKQSAKFGLPRITLVVDSTNTPAITLYKRWNFLASRQRLSMIKKLY